MLNAKVTINVTDLEPVAELSRLFAEALQDERIPLSIRIEYLNKIDAIEARAKRVANEGQVYGNDCPGGQCDA